MVYRICKQFVVENGHMLSKNPGKCRFPHGHSRRVDVVLSAETLDDNDMVCDFSAVKAAVSDLIDRFDHAICVNSADPLLPSLKETFPERLIVYDGQDPTTEVLAKQVFDHLSAQIATGFSITDPVTGTTFSIAGHVRVERVRIQETPSSWAEYARA